MDFAMNISRNDLKDELKVFSLSLQRALRGDFEEICTRLRSLESVVQAGNNSKDMISSRPLSPSPPKADPPNLSSDAMLNSPTEEIECYDVIAKKKDADRSSVSFSEAKLGLHQRRGSDHHDWLAHHWRSYATGQEEKLKHEQQKLKRSATAKIFSEPERTNASDVKKLAFEDTKWDELDTDDSDVKNSCRMNVELVVSSNIFQSTIAMSIFINAFTIGWQTEYMATHKVDDIPLVFRVLELGFCILFTIEIIMKLIAYGWLYFRQPGWRWNVFDLILVSIQLIEECVQAVVPFSLFDFSAMRVLRILRVVRVIRVIRLIRLISDLRAIVSSILASFRALIWTILLLFLVIYMIAVYLTQLYVEERLQGRPLHEFSHFYSDLPRSILTLYECMSGGLDWDVAVEPLMKDFSPLYGLVFSLYISFTVLALMNVVTGVFVESALQSARDDKKIYIINHIQALIDAMLIDKEGHIGWEMFEAKLATPEMAEVFSFIDVDPMEARGLFKLLDLNGNGSVDSKEFLDGCLRLRGPAKALDMALLMNEVRRLAQLQKTQFKELIEATRIPQTVNFTRGGALRIAASDIGHFSSK